jgi:hypothetical protein
MEHEDQYDVYNSSTYLYPEPHQSSPTPFHPTYLSSILILHSHLSPCLPSGLLPSGSPPKPSTHFSCYPYVPHNPLVSSPGTEHPNNMNRIVCGVEYRSWSFSSRSFLHTAVTSSILRLNIFVSTLLLNTHSAGNTDQVLHPHKNQRQNYGFGLLPLFPNIYEIRMQDTIAT